MNASNSFELYYNTGGHGGPYPDLAAAEIAAKRMLAGCRSLYSVEIRPRNSPVLGGYGESHKGSRYIWRGQGGAACFL